MDKFLIGKCLILGDNIDTDAIVPGRFLREKNIENYALAGLGAGMPQKLRGFSFIVAGKNFGCGSSREQAPLALKRAGIKCVIAESFARIFYRNAINVGLAAVECLLSDGTKNAVAEGDELEVELKSGAVRNKTKRTRAQAAPLSKFALDVLEAGGLIAYCKKSSEGRRSRLLSEHTKNAGSRKSKCDNCSLVSITGELKSHFDFSSEG